MNLKILIMTFGTWFLFMILAVINAVIRNGVYKPIIGDLRAHQLSTIIFIVFILIFTYLIFRFSNITLTPNETYLIGIIWFLMTIGFEFLAGHYIFGNSWEHLFADYNILKGRIWVFVPLTLLFSPYLIHKIV
jgi:hypothetical protein